MSWEDKQALARGYLRLAGCTCSQSLVGWQEKNLSGDWIDDPSLYHPRCRLCNVVAVEAIRLNPGEMV